MDLFEKDLENFSTGELKCMARYYNIDDKLSRRALVKKIAKSNYKTYQAHMDGDRQLSQPPIYARIVRTLSFEEMMNLCQVNKEFAEVCRSGLIWKEWAKAHEEEELDKALIEMARSGDLRIVKYFVESGADIHADNDDVLSVAAWGGHLKVVKYLVENGADIHAEYDAALGIAAGNGHLEVVKYLVENGADIYAVENEAVRRAEEYGHPEVVKYLKGIKELDDSLIKMAESGDLRRIRYLVENGADTHAKNDEALRVAAENGHLEVVKYLVETGADIHAEDDYAVTSAAGKGHLDIVKYLVENGADIHAKNDETLRWATKNGHLEVVTYLEGL